MKRLFRIVSTVIMALIVAEPILSAQLPASSVYYVRPDGGSADECTGLADAAYPGNGTE